MSQDRSTATANEYADLVSRLRMWALRNGKATGIPAEESDDWKAADAIERLTSSAERRMTPRQLEALRMLNDAFESHDGRAVDQAIITKPDYRLLYEALAEGTTGDRIAAELLGQRPIASSTTESWRATLEEVASTLDKALGDTDITHIENDDELRERAPVQWACSQINKLLTLSATRESGEDASPSTATKIR